MRHSDPSLATKLALILAAALLLGARPSPGLKQILVVFHNDIWDDAYVDQYVRIFYTRDQVLQVIAGEQGFEKNNREFTAWLKGLKKPGFHVYGEGFADNGFLVTRLLQTQPGWVCCGADRIFVPTKDLTVEAATEEQAAKEKRAGPEPFSKYFQMHMYNRKYRVWPFLPKR